MQVKCPSCGEPLPEGATACEQCWQAIVIDTPVRAATPLLPSAGVPRPERGGDANPEPAGPPAVSWPTVFAGVAADGAANSVCQGYGRLFALPTDAIWCVLVLASTGSLFAGVFTSAIGGFSKTRHVLYAATAAALWSLGTMGCLWCALGHDKGFPTGSPGLQPGTAFTVLGGIGLLLGLGTLLGFFLGHRLEVWLAAWSRRYFARKFSTFQTQTGLAVPVAAPWRHPFLGSVWACAGAALVLSFWLPLFTAYDTRNTGDEGSGRVPANVALEQVVGIIALGVACLHVARRNLCKSAEEVLRQDHRPPVVYLRSFASDGEERRGFFQAMFTGVRSLLTKTPEQRLASAASRLGPFVAIGRPGEELPELGAARLYVGDDDWQLVVTDLLSRPGAKVILQVGETQGLRQEVGFLSRYVRPDHVILFVPFPNNVLPSRRGRDREKLYAGFRQWAQTCFPAELPELIGKAFCLFFASQARWDARLLKGPKTLPESHPMRPALERLTEEAAFGGRQRFEWLLLSLLLFIIMVLLIGIFLIEFYLVPSVR